MKVVVQHTIEEPLPRQRSQLQVSRLIIAACIIELCCLLIDLLSPLPALRLNDTPIAAAWTWLLAPAHLLSTSMEQAEHWLAPMLLALVFACLLTMYGLMIRELLRRMQSQEQQQASRLLLFLLGSTMVFGLTLLIQPKLFSDDVFSYIISGRILTVYHADPLNTAPIQFPDDPYVRWVIAGRYAPNIYGPLWYCICWLLDSLRTAPIGTLLLFKGLALLSHLLNGLLVWCILSTVAPARRMLGTLLYLWNPLILISLAGGGHSDGVLLTLLLTATLLYTWRSAHEHSSYLEAPARFVAMLLFGVAVSMNLIVLLIVPLLAWFDVRAERKLARAFVGATLRCVLILLPALAIWFPFWRGATTFFALTSAVNMEHFVHSPLGLLVGPNRLFFKLLAYVLRFPWDPIPAADVTLRGSATFVFALLYSNLFSQVRHAPTTIAGMRYSDNADPNIEVPGIDTLFRTWGIALFTYIALVTGWFWPWYLLWLLWVVMLQRLDLFTSTMLVLSGTALFFYVFASDIFQSIAITHYEPALIFGLPLVYLLIRSYRTRHV
ncbi:MAG TPA: hypothetical protein DHW02_10565 [Ktedonobacter sp.]|nr:hypothetical protein [Ktedonobacter sp.]